MENTGGPTAALSRQNLPTLEGTSAEAVRRGAYVLREASSQPEIILLASGSEVSLAVEAAAKLESLGHPTRVVSAPCLEAYEAQEGSYRDQVLPPSCPVRVVVEAGRAQGWEKFVGPWGGMVLSVGESAPIADLQKAFGFTVDNVVQTALETESRWAGLNLFTANRFSRLSRRISIEPPPIVLPATSLIDPERRGSAGFPRSRAKDTQSVPLTLQATEDKQIETDEEGDGG